MELVKDHTEKKECQHLVFGSECFVFKISESEQNPEKIIAYAADIKINCAECGEAMEFLGLPIGLSLNKPTTDEDCTILRVPIRPSSLPPIINENKIIN